MQKRRFPSDKAEVLISPPDTQITAILQLATAALQSGCLDDAERHARLVLAAHHQNALALTVIGWTSLSRDRFDEAIDSFERVRVIQSKDASVRFGLGEAYRHKGNLDQALRNFRKAILLKPRYAEAHAQIGETLRALGRSAEAAEAYQAALALNPNLPHCLNGFGLLLVTEGKMQEAIPLFDAACRAVPPQMVSEHATFLANLGSARIDTGDLLGGIAAFSEAVDLVPGEPTYWRLLARSLSYVKDVPRGSSFRKLLIKLLRRPDIDPVLVATAAVASLKHDPTFGELLTALAEFPTQSKQTLAASSDIVEAILQDELFAALISATPIRDLGLELLLTSVRREFVIRRHSEHRSSMGLDLICNVARQCFLNEYAFWMEQDENAALSNLWAGCELSGFTDWNNIAVLACYFALERRLPPSLDLAGAPEPLRTLLQRQLQDVVDESKLSEIIVKLEPVREQVSLLVQQQYEESPYPRWTRCQMGVPLRFREAVTLALPHVDPCRIPPIQYPRVLIAGCGTGIQTMRVLQSYAEASVVAVDLSRSSLTYSLRKLREYGIQSVQHVQADILDLANLEDRFDLIESFGVLHHMRNPMTGLRVLADLLKVDGLLFLGLYSQIARSGVVAGRKLLSELALSPTSDGLRAGRRAIISSSDNQDLRALLSPASDFWTLSEFRDLLFHVEEHHFTLLDIESMLESCGLEFLGLELTRSVDRARFAVEHPNRASLSSLSAWHHFETRFPDTFGDTYRIWSRRA